MFLNSLFKLIEDALTLLLDEVFEVLIHIFTVKPIAVTGLLGLAEDTLVKMITVPIRVKEFFFDHDVISLF